MHIRGLIGQEGSLTCYLPVLVQSVLGDILEEGTVDPGSSAEPESDTQVGTDTRAEGYATNGTRSGDSESELVVTRKRTIREDEEEEEDAV